MARKLVSADGDSDRSIQTGESDGENGGSDAPGGLLNRRDYVKCSALAAGGILASSGVGSAAVERHGIQFDRVVNAVNDLGMDPNGNDPIDSALISAYESGTLVEFPEGTYRVESELLWRDDKSNFGMRGLGDSHTDVEFTFPNADDSGSGWWFFKQTGGTDVLMENFSIQQTMDSTTSVSILLQPEDDGKIIDVEWLGFIPSNAHSYGQLLRMDVTSQDGVNLARRVTMGRDGAHMGGHAADTNDNPGTTFVLVYDQHIGEMQFEDVWFEQCRHNSIRSIRGDGVVRILDSTFLNCDMGGARIHNGDHPSKGSVIDNCEIVHDQSRLKELGSDPTSYPHHCAGVFVDSYEGYDGPTVRNCEIEYLDLSETMKHTNYLWGAIRVTKTGISHPGPITVMDTRIHNETVAPNIWIQERQSRAKNSENVFDNVQFTFDNDTTSQGPWMMYVGPGWDESRITNSCFHAPSGDVDGIEFVGCDNIVVKDSNLNVTGEAVQLIDTDGKVRSITYDGICDDTSESSGDTDASTDDRSTNDGSTDDSDGTVDGWHSFVIDGVDSNTWTDYEFVVDGDVRKDTELSEYGSVGTIEALDDGTVRVAGSIRSGVDAFGYEGAIISYTAGSDVLFERDGEEITQDQVVDGESDTTEDPDGDTTDESADQDWHSFVIDGVDSNTWTDYEFVVDGDARENTELSEYGSVGTIEALNDGTVRVAGSIRSGVDAFDYVGYIQSFAVGPDVLFERDGEEITHDQVVDREFEHDLRVVGVGTPSEYDFTVDGELVAHPTCEDGCLGVVSGDRATGEVLSDEAQFLFDGSLSEFSLNGDAGVYLDGKQVDPDLLVTDEDPVLTNWLTVDGVEDETSYQFSVSGNLYKSPDIGSAEADDTVSDGMVIGTVTDDVDGYRFSGDLTMMRVQGTADLNFNE